MLKHVDVIAMPYKAIDLNTKYGFPNKLGDCLTFQIPYIYNQELLEIDKVANLTKTGVRFSWQACLNDPKNLERALDESTKLDSNWRLANKEFGWENFQHQIQHVVNDKY